MTQTDLTSKFSFRFPYKTLDGRRRVGVLHLQGRRAARHGVLRAAQEAEPGLVPASVPPHADAGLRLRRRQVLCR